MGADIHAGRRALRGKLVADTPVFCQRFQGTWAGGMWLCKRLHHAQRGAAFSPCHFECVGDKHHKQHWEVLAS